MLTLYFHMVIASVLLSLFLGLYTLFTNKHAFLNRSFFRLSLAISLLSISYYFASGIVSAETGKIFLKILSLTLLLIPVLFLQFICALTIPGNRKVKLYLNLLYAVSLFLFVFGLSDGATILLYFVLISAGVYLLYKWKIKNKGNIREKQASLIIYTTFLVFILLSVYRRIFFKFFNTIPPPFLPVFLNLWLIAVASAIFKYHLMVDFPRIIQMEILNHVSDIIVILNLDERIIFVNTRTAELSGYNPDDLKGRHYSILFSSSIPGSENRIEKSFLTRNGVEIPVLVSAYSYNNKRGQLVGRIITASDQRIMNTLQNEIIRKESVMLKLRESEQKFSAIFNSSPAGMILFEINSGNLIDVNSRAKHITGFSKSEIRNLAFIINRIMVNNKENRELIHLLKKNSQVLNRNVLINSKWGIRKTVLVSFDSVKLSGKEYFLIAGSDITESVRLKEQLITTKKLESIGVLAGGIAHDFNNMLSIINGNLSMALSMLDDPEVREFIEDSLEAGRNAATLTRQLLTFSKGRKPLFSETDLHSLIRDSVKIALSGKDTTASLYLDALRFMVYGDKNQLQQVFINLIINSVQAMNNDGEITISTRNDNENKNIIVSITDFGKGIPEDKISKIFDPFFSTKSKGSGLGLSIVYSIITNHHGTIEVSSSKKEGTTFTITLPLQGQS